MKRIFLFTMVLISILVFASCSSADLVEDNVEDTTVVEEPVIEVQEFEIAFITDGGGIDDQSYNQATWEGLNKYADENALTITAYIPEQVEHTAYVKAIDEAIAGGARVVVCLGPFLNPAVYELQYSYPGVQFILLNGEPHTQDYQTYAIEDNVYATYFSEEEIGFLAGYAAVKDGYTELGYIGGLAIEPDINAGYGFISGAQYAAKEDKVKGIDIMYHYSGSVQASEDVQTVAGLWYNAGTELIFSCGDSVSENVITTAETVGTSVISCGYNDSNSADVIVTSEMKDWGFIKTRNIEKELNQILPNRKHRTIPVIHTPYKARCRLSCKALGTNHL